MTFQETAVNWGTKLKDHVMNLAVLSRFMFLVMSGLFITSVYLPIIPRYTILSLDSLRSHQYWRLFTYSFVPPSIISLIIDLIFFIGMLGRFEADIGTLAAAIQIFTVFPVLSSLMFFVIDFVLLRTRSTLLGAGMLFFTLIGNESMKNHAMNPTTEVYFISKFNVPTWAFPIMLLAIFTFITSIAHVIALLCALAVGYGYALGYLNYLQVPRRIIISLEERLTFLSRIPGFVEVSSAQYYGGGKIDSGGYISLEQGENDAPAFPGSGNTLGA